MNRPITNGLTLLLSWALGGLFVWAGLVKFSAPKAFSRSIDGFGLVPEPLLPTVAIGLPLLEVLVGLAVIRRWRFGLPAMTTLLILFIAVLGLAVWQNLDVDCGCFSVAEQRAHTSTRTALWRDVLLLAGVALLGWIGQKSGDQNNRKSRKAPSSQRTV